MSKEPMSGLQMVLDNIRPSFEYNVSFVEKFLNGRGLDMGCGNCPLLKSDCIHVDMSPQPLAALQVQEENVVLGDAVRFSPPDKVDYIFSSHMVEDLPNVHDMEDCLLGWAMLLRPRGFIVLLVPDMQGGRYPKVDDPSGNPSHRVDVGREFFENLAHSLLHVLEIVQIDTIPHDRSCTMDVVFQRRF